ncbi:hypothetical protein NQ318_004058 [Aromia moschata]|uniref:Uncharacterized protein n=1 Tax=Aromia moschata TaxID=1265417 RepID=A0AAV8Z8W9_9CUCU|nr:hypothetical protein NQ318_004058 [Aromia moschata]
MSMILHLSHELGHSFGSDHDTTPPCAGYMMASHTPTDNRRKRFIFSSCSKRSIVKTVVSKGHCFESYENPFCGNEVTEKGVFSCVQKRQFCDDTTPLVEKPSSKKERTATAVPQETVNFSTCAAYRKAKETLAK